MSDDSPTPPTEIPTDVVDALEECSPEQLRRIARYAEALADHGDRETTAEAALNDEETSDDEEPDRRPDDAPDDTPDDVPSKATITIKEINDNRYYYWQWREGDEIKSRYEAPVDADE